MKALRTLGGRPLQYWERHCVGSIHESTVPIPRRAAIFYLRNDQRPFPTKRGVEIIIEFVGRGLCSRRTYSLPRGLIEPADGQWPSLQYWERHCVGSIHESTVPTPHRAAIFYPRNDVGIVPYGKPR